MMQNVLLVSWRFCKHLHCSFMEPKACEQKADTFRWWVNSVVSKSNQWFDIQLNIGSSRRPWAFFSVIVEIESWWGRTSVYTVNKRADPGSAWPDSTGTLTVMQPLSNHINLHSLCSSLASSLWYQMEHGASILGGRCSSRPSQHIWDGPHAGSAERRTWKCVI